MAVARCSDPPPGVAQPSSAGSDSTRRTQASHYAQHSPLLSYCSFSRDLTGRRRATMPSGGLGDVDASCGDGYGRRVEMRVSE